MHFPDYNAEEQPPKKFFYGVSCLFNDSRLLGPFIPNSYKKIFRQQSEFETTRERKKKRAIALLSSERFSKRCRRINFYQVRNHFTCLTFSEKNGRGLFLLKASAKMKRAPAKRKSFELSKEFSEFKKESHPQI